MRLTSAFLIDDIDRLSETASPFEGHGCPFMVTQYCLAVKGVLVRRILRFSIFR
jgi:hypothetical protein